MRVHRRPQRAFTLVEMICVITILAILASVSLPRMMNVSSKAQQAVHKEVTKAFSRTVLALHARWILDQHNARQARSGSGAFLAMNDPKSTEIGYWRGSGYPECATECHFDGKLSAQDCMAIAAVLLEQTVPFDQDYTATTLPESGGDCIYVRKDSPENKIRYSALSGMVKSCQDSNSCNQLTGSTLLGDY